jgi:hypothetical protein
MTSEFALATAQDFSGGQDVSRGLSNVPENRYYAGVNTSASKGVLKPRWGFSRLPLTFVEGGLANDNGDTKSYKEIFEGGKFQAAVSFYIDGDPYIACVISGQIFLVNIATSYVSVIHITDGSRINGRLPRVNRTIAGAYGVFYDYPDFPVLLNGAAARRADPASYEVPVSRLGAYNQSRLFIVNGGNEFTGGDPVGNTVATEPPITFEEVLIPGAAYYLQIFQMPTDFTREPITSMATLQAVDTSTGIGPLLIGTARGVYAYGTHVPRGQWEAGQFGSSIVSQVGVVGPRAFVNANSDAFFMSMDGHIRSISMAKNEQRMWSRIPISREVANWIKINDKTLLQHSVVEYFNNKVFFSVNPFRMEVTNFASGLPISDYAFGGMVVLELDNLSSFGEPAAPAWAGLWTGVRPMEFVTVDDRMFIFSKDYYSTNRIYEVDPNLTYDTADDKVRQIKSRIYTGNYDCGNKFNRKRMHSLELGLESIKGDFNLKVSYKPSHVPYLYPWREVTHKAPWRLNDLNDDCTLNGFEAHSKRDFIIGFPEEDECNPISDELLAVFKEVQLYLEITGIYWELSDFRLKAVEHATTYNESMCDALKEDSLCAAPNTDWNYEEFTGCQELQT